MNDEELSQYEETCKYAEENERIYNHATTLHMRPAALRRLLEAAKRTAALERAVASIEHPAPVPAEELDAAALREKLARAREIITRLEADVVSCCARVDKAWKETTVLWKALWPFAEAAHAAEDHRDAHDDDVIVSWEGCGEAIYIRLAHFRAARAALAAGEGK